MEGKINIYTCQNCSKQITTQDKADGVTPFMISCDEEGCDGMCYSAFYRVPQDITKIDYYWVRLNDNELLEEAKRGVREITDKNPEWAAEIKRDLKIEPEEFMLQSIKEHADNGGLFHVKAI